MSDEKRWHAQLRASSPKGRMVSRFQRLVISGLARNVRARRRMLHHLFSRHLGDGVLCLVPFDDHSIFVDPRDDKIAYTLLCGQAWQRSELEQAFASAASEGRLEDGRVFVDVGANIGAMTLYALLSRRFRHVIAIEPDHWNRALLERNIEANGFNERVSVVAGAVSSKSGKMTLYRDAKNLGAHSLEAGFVMSPAAADAAITVETLDNIVEQTGFQVEDVGFVKIDVEGHELAVLEGMEAILAKRPPILLEATFGLDTPTAESIKEALLGVLSASYQSYVEITDHKRVDGQCVTRPLRAFHPSALQHELLIM